MAIGFALTAALQLWSAGLLDWIPADVASSSRCFVHSFCLRYGGALLARSEFERHVCPSGTIANRQPTKETDIF